MLKILPLGDSLTEGTADLVGGYRGPLQAKLLEADYEFDFVGSRTGNSAGLADPEHEGYPGFRIEWLRTGRKGVDSVSMPLAVTLKRFQPDVILLLAGTNNLYFDSPVSASAEMRLLLDVIFGHAPDVTLILGGITPILPGPKPWGSVIPADVSGRVQEYNDRLCRLVRAFRGWGHEIAFADHSRCFLNTDDLLSDGVHPAAQAMRRMADVWFEELDNLLSPTRECQQELF
jgi:lysophospholipase L1-like esterase